MLLNAGLVPARIRNDKLQKNGFSPFFNDKRKQGRHSSIMMGMGMALVPPTSGEKGVKSCKF